ncbi:hypothetical protein [Bdellovibrio reynosensis]|uniref:OmpA-like domain-containing protein n=1 Tax=Bdellovibrio reynosensis TaxID=2835041 RepID=A0ABY4CA54_9BACT|nr:hypothetical protein [Bdellovibrio reynosensis]UOF01797.1 hypothetical protein MNR06_02370 [Bdellovibrio reynosensis]
MTTRILGSMLVVLSFISINAFAGVNSETEDSVKGLGAAKVMEIEFEEGKADLSEDAKKEIREQIAEAKEGKKIDSLQVASWPDKEYPTKDVKPSKGDVELAKKRGENVKTFIKDEMKAVSSVRVFNMSERPNPLEKFLRTKEAKVKNTLEASGAAPRTKDETGFFGTKGKASKALIMIYYE